MFDFSVLATTVLRLVVGVILMIEGSRFFKNTSFLSILSSKASLYIKKIPAVIELVGGTLLFIGLFTQPAAIILSLTILVRLYTVYKEKPADPRIFSFYVLLFFVTLSFLFFGPGMASLDYPL